ncbi:hypothetical protein [Uliginosibacterium sp. TH139]|uniref:hypothetical protein n=1 Tax=Uliginosibacterium sp. TH139 TaxID=2067453 RepID=UPI000C7B7065|nr:hypothetical protein [Uliginosibacterium sp. TH139]PLK50140.1 hypothetical protein C0V76_06970 [Uliginosibacterium sp. TH139]
MNRSDVESFFKTLLLGDFEENQNTAAQLVGGLISLVPVLDQVMDARDITGSLFLIQKRGGFKHASTDQIVNLGFAAFGAIPEVGSAFKTVFKPIWKERRAAKGAVHSGLNAIEHLLGMKKGGAIAWVRNELIGKWSARTNEAIQSVEAGLDACIALTEFLATANGWKNWLVPDPIQVLAKEMLPGLKSLKGKLSAPLRRASDEIRHLLEDLLGEQAAAVVMAVGGRAATASAVPATRTRAGHNAAAEHPKDKAPIRQPDKKVSDKHEADAKKGAGPVHTATQARRNRFADLANKYVGVQGEHMSDYYCQNTKGWGKSKAHHDKEQVNDAKLNDGGKLVQLWPSKTRGRGIDGAWRTGGSKPYAIIEAKYSLDPTKSLAALLGESWDKSEGGSGGNKGRQDPNAGGASRAGKRGAAKRADPIRQTNGKITQMSHGWVQGRRLEKAVGEDVAADIRKKGYLRYVQFFSVPQTVAHSEALLKHITGDPVQPSFHAAHEITREWGDSEIDKVVDNRAGFKDAGRNKSARQP